MLALTSIAINSNALPTL
ncbi:hypothetical protein GQ607_015205 [Colletotrichum asianum]|uniref:Uncharacterized protein n=1 Tax=Colletotrichum asianum TaxID=702518 RepID=A0A8H3VZ62_9PEZI|nr:hypothetical protein GQ607_015205 [Colletotrichum asianum]